MAPLKKCCVGGCTATNVTHYLFCMPKNDNLRSLWMAFLLLTNPLLNGLTKSQLLNKRVCNEHFDKHELYGKNRRTRKSYPCFFSANEIANGVPLSSEESHPVQAEDNNHQLQEENDNYVTAEPIINSEPDEHHSCLQIEAVPEHLIEETTIEDDHHLSNQIETVPEDSIEETTIDDEHHLSNHSCLQIEAVPEHLIEETTIEDDHHLLSNHNWLQIEAVPEHSIEDTTIEEIPGNSQLLKESISTQPSTQYKTIRNISKKRKYKKEKFEELKKIKIKDKGRIKKNRQDPLEKEKIERNIEMLLMKYRLSVTTTRTVENIEDKKGRENRRRRERKKKKEEEKGREINPPKYALSNYIFLLIPK